MLPDYSSPECSTALKVITVTCSMAVGEGGGPTLCCSLVLL